MPSTNGHGPKIVVLYARVSTDEQARTGHNLSQPIAALRKYTTREGYEVLEELAARAELSFPDKVGSGLHAGPGSHR